VFKPNCYPIVMDLGTDTADWVAIAPVCTTDCIMLANGAPGCKEDLPS
jgi:hypothetical protein